MKQILKYYYQSSKEKSLNSSYEWLLLILLFLSACYPAEINKTLVPATKGITQDTGTNLQTSTEIPGFADITLEMSEECVNIIPDPPSNLNGVLVFHESIGDSLLFLDLMTGNQKRVPEKSEAKVWNAYISPNGKWLVYEYKPQDSHGEYALGLANADGAQENAMEFGDWNVGSIFWLNNNRLRITEPNNDLTYLHNFFLDPFTGEKTPLPSEFPRLGGRGIQWGVDQNAVQLGVLKGINILYDPTLSRALYPKTGNPPTISLFDLDTNKEIEDLIFTGKPRLPKWSPTGDNFAVISSAGNTANERLDEILIISRDGSEVSQLKYSTSGPETLSIEDYSWSPDGTSIAFWIKTDPSIASSQNNHELAVLNLEANKITKYCISGMATSQFESEFGKYTTSANLIWSPDSNQIFFARKGDGNSDGTETVIVDLENRSAYIVIENMQPIGWMTR